MKSALRAALGALLLATALTAPAQEMLQPCRMHNAGRWTTLGDSSLNACLANIDRSVPGYNSQGFKFGAWGDALLAVDEARYYRSSGGGNSWSPIGSKSEMAAAAPQPATQAQPPAPAPSLSQAQPTTPSQSMYETSTLPPVESSSIYGSPLNSTGTPDAEMGAMIETRGAAAAAPPPKAFGGATRSCSLPVGGAWKEKVTTLDDCADALDRSADDYDANGFKYGYWSGIFLAADKTSIYRSSDNEEWSRMRSRGNGP
jgi:hypothetical protein